MRRVGTEDRKVPDAGFWLKFDRAVLRSNEAWSIHHAWSHACIDSRTGEGRITQPNPAFSLSASEAVQGFRQSLEHLAFALTVAEHGNLSEGEARRVTFPSTAEQLKGMRISAEATRLLKIELDIGLAGRSISDLLRILFQVSNVDRHRLLPVLMLASVRYIPVEGDGSPTFHTAAAHWDLGELGCATHERIDVRKLLDLTETAVGRILAAVEHLA